jgi:hypothetical protein
MVLRKGRKVMSKGRRVMGKGLCKGNLGREVYRIFFSQTYQMSARSSFRRNRHRVKDCKAVE